MKAGNVVKISLVALLVLGLAAYVVYATVFLSEPGSDEKCVMVELSVKKNSQANFVNEKEIETMLKNAHVYPKGMLMNEVNTKKIEEVIRANDLIQKVECYKTTNGKLCVKVEQRVPVIYILPEGKSGYFVDSQGKKIPNTNYAVNLVTASGNIDEKYACSKLADFGQYLQTDAFWNNQIEQIYVTKNKKGEHVVELVPRVGNHIVYLGSIDEYQKKLRKLRTFYDKAMGTVGWNKYAKINLEYGNQIICTKRSK
ncbi:MAG: cell division protein FtsQ [Prevotellaceae bacterium]|nr:cell division protein FtsQ [Candidatus Minthosoma caballi]